MLHVRPLLLSLCALGLVVFTTACGGTQVTRLDPDEEIDLSGRWNDVDNKRVANEMVPQALQAGWLAAFQARHDRKPAIQLSQVPVISNGDIINTDAFLVAIRNAFINSGKAKVIGTIADAQLTRAVLADQDLNAADDSRKERFQETGTDFILHGKITVQDDMAGRTRIKVYYVDLALTNVQTREQVWAHRKTLKKKVENARFR
ncbi:MAG: penicillin-binding protein activator LpoB [Planctomycetota bacterium]